MITFWLTNLIPKIRMLAILIFDFIINIIYFNFGVLGFWGRSAITDARYAAA